MIDTHSHIYSEEFDKDIDEVITSAQKTGIENVILANVDIESISKLDGLQQRYPDFCMSAMGLHPTSIKADYLQTLQTIKEHLYTKKYVAIGEIGIDLYWDKTFIAEQKIAFKQQIEWALELELPIIIHIRDAFAEAFDVLKRFGGKLPKGVFHCFSGGIQEAKYAVNLGFKLGIGGVVTFKNTNLPKVIKTIGLEHIILETDAPYLSPVPYRGKRNEPKYMIEVAKKLADIFNITIDDIDKITTKTAKEIFVYK